jgi:hypothetical protein
MNEFQTLAVFSDDRAPAAYTGIVVKVPARACVPYIRSRFVQSSCQFCLKGGASVDAYQPPSQNQNVLTPRLLRPPIRGGQELSITATWAFLSLLAGAFIADDAKDADDTVKQCELGGLL